MKSARFHWFPVCCLFLGLSQFALAESQALKPLLPDYLAIQEALASDRLAPAQEAARRLQKSASQGKLTRDPDSAVVRKRAEEIIKASGLEQARESFKPLSNVFVSDRGDAASSETEVVACSMAKAKWIQKKGEIRNPYYGKSMLNCGERT